MADKYYNPYSWREYAQFVQVAEAKRSLDLNNLLDSAWRAISEAEDLIKNERYEADAKAIEVVPDLIKTLEKAYKNEKEKLEAEYDRTIKKIRPYGQAEAVAIPIPIPEQEQRVIPEMMEMRDPKTLKTEEILPEVSKALVEAEKWLREWWKPSQRALAWMFGRTEQDPRMIIYEAGELLKEGMKGRKNELIAADKEIQRAERILGDMIEWEPIPQAALDLIEYAGDLMYEYKNRREYPFIHGP